MEKNVNLFMESVLNFLRGNHSYHVSRAAERFYHRVETEFTHLARRMDEEVADLHTVPTGRGKTSDNQLFYRIPSRLEHLPALLV